MCLPKPLSLLPPERLTGDGRAQLAAPKVSPSAPILLLSELHQDLHVPPHPLKLFLAANQVGGDNLKHFLVSFPFLQQMMWRFHLAGHGQKFLMQQLRHHRNMDGKEAWSCRQIKRNTENINKKRETGKREEGSLPS